ncbi:MAG: sugar phosphate isomerase/epimerase family protein, partial [Kiritimatiellia bacterium]|nr:sugar phosphate isomerase/epimerase family protein [Kiritimatiellia bacterium]
MKISISTGIFDYDFPFEKGIKMLRAAGYSLVEISRKNLNIGGQKPFIDSMGLKVWSVHGMLGGDSASLSEELREKSVRSELGIMEDAAVFAPCPYVVHYLDRYNDPVYGKKFRKSIEQLHEKAVELNLNLAIETAPYKPEQNERYPSSKEISDFVRSFHSPNVSLCLDVNHSNLNEKFEDACRNCKGLISDIHVSDNHGGREEHLSPGLGVINFPAVFRSLRRAGYKGPCNLECHLEEAPTVEKLAEVRLFIENQIKLS